MRSLVLALILLAAGPAARAGAQEPALSLAARDDKTGYVALHVAGPPGAQVTVYDTTGGAGQPVGALTLTTGQADLPRAARWRCTPRHRTFRADARTAAGAILSAGAALTTPRCRRRLTLHVRPSHPRARRPLTVLLVDRWKIGGVTAHACAHGPAGRRRCHRITLADGRARAAWRFRPGRAGRWRIGVRARGAPTRRDAAFVRPASGRLSLLATGDSMIQIIDGFLDHKLQSARVGVHSDARISTGISKPALLNWPLHARAQARGLRPDVTVMFLGANDGFPLHGVACCGRAWEHAYARRVSGMMSTYARHGAGTVYWATLPAPRSASFRRVYRVVNAALHDAARRHPGEVHIVPLAHWFTPGFHFRQSIRWHGRLVSVRQGDGVHLNVAGASIAATLIIRTMRRHGVI